MTPVELFVAFAICLNIALGATVFLTNPRRGANQHYLTLTAVSACWLLATYFILQAEDSVIAAIMLQAAAAFGAMIPMACHLIRMAIKYPDENGWQIIVRARYLLAMTFCIVLLCYSDAFLKGVVMPSAGDGTPKVVEPVYGTPFYIFLGYLFAMTVSLCVMFVKDRKRLTGSNRIELDFVIFGSITALVIGIVIGQISAVIAKNSQYIPVSNAVSLLILNSIVAYGIATRRIMGIATFIRRLAVYLILTIYLSLLYIIVWNIAGFAIGWMNIRMSLLPHLLAALAIAFSMRPAQGWFQAFANRLLFSSLSLDATRSAREANRILQSVTTVGALLGQFVKFLARTLDTDEVVILLEKGNGFVQRAPHALQDPMFIEKDSAIATALQDRGQQSHLAADNIKRRAITAESNAVLHEMKELHALVVAGIYSKNMLAGMIVLGPRISKNVYDHPYLDALQIFTSQMAIALENARLYTRVQNQKIYMESLLENLVNGVVAVDTVRQITICNREAQRIIGVESKDINWQDCELPAPMKTVIEDLYENEHSLRNQEIAFRNRRGEDISLQLGGTLLYGHKGELIGALLVFNDQTAIKRLESQIRRSERLASAGQLAAGMAHEIKNPLVAIKTFAELLPTRFDDREFRESYTPLVGEEINRIDEIVNQLMDFARPAHPHSKPVHVHEIISRVVQLLKQHLKKADITLKQHLLAKNDLVRGDPNQIHQVFVNIILNAISAMNNGNGRLTIGTETIEWLVKEENSQKMNTPGPYINIAFSDTGNGIGEKELSKIFDPFYTNSAGGTGMGLPVAHGIVTEHQGVISVESEPGEGSTFTVTLPIIHEESVV